MDKQAGDKLVKVSVIVVVYNNEIWVEQCLDSLLAQSYENIEVIFVDNGSEDKSLQLAQQRKYEKLDIKFKHHTENLGFAVGNNAGAEMATGDILFLLNSDARIGRDVIVEAVKFFAARPGAVVVQNKLLQMDNPEKFDSAGSLMTNTGFLRHLLNEMPLDEHGSYKVFSAKGASMFVKRSFLQESFLFNPIYHSYFEDSDLCWRAWLLGGEVYYLSKGVTYHKGGATGLFLTSGYSDFHSFKNRLYSILANMQTKTIISTLPIHLSVCFVVITAYLFRFKFSKAWAICRALGWVVVNFGSVIKLRKVIQKKRKRSDKEIMQLAGTNMSLPYAVGALFGYTKR